MIRFTIRLLLKNKVLWLWPILCLGFALVIGIWGDIHYAQTAYSFIINIGELSVPSGLLIPHIISILVLIAVIGVPTHFSKNIEPERAALILSEPVSRTDFFWADLAGTFLISLFYTLITMAVFALLLSIKAAIFPVEFFLALLIFIPLYVMIYYVSILLFLILTNSYLASVLLGYFLVGFISGLLLHAEQFLHLLGFTSAAAQQTAYVLSYFIPSSAGIQQLIQSVLGGGFTAFDGGLFAFILISVLPFLALSYYLFSRKEF